jgi:hypothetical protein
MKKIQIYAPEEVLDDLEMTYGLGLDDLFDARVITRHGFFGPIEFVFKIPDKMYEWGQEQLGVKSKPKKLPKRRKTRAPHSGRWGTRP